MESGERKHTRNDKEVASTSTQGAEVEEGEVGREAQPLPELLPERQPGVVGARGGTANTSDAQQERSYDASSDCA